MDAFEAVSLPESSPRPARRSFTVAEADRALVLVRRIVADIVRDYRRLCELHRSFYRFDSRGSSAQAEEARQEYVRLTDQLSELREELEEIGCELKDYERGLVDFPSQRQGRPILLCWKLGEDRVRHWHEIDAGFGGRQPITEEA
ncbi:MAG: DUF2203 domain-containing protein [Phycisphaerae bacterium]|jgi:hypothetical protein